MYIDKLDDIVNKYNNKYHISNKMKPADVKWNTYIDSSKEINNKDPKFRIGDVTFQIGLKKFLWLKKLKILCREHMLLMILMEKKLLEHFTKPNCKKQIKMNLELKSN